MLAGLALRRGRALWHGPMGARRPVRARRSNATLAATLAIYEMTHDAGPPASRPADAPVDLSGPADDFQRAELVRAMETLPGVSDATWSARPRRPAADRGRQPARRCWASSWPAARLSGRASPPLQRTMELVTNGRSRNIGRIIVVVRGVVLASSSLLRPRQRVQLTDSAPVRPHMASQAPARGPRPGRRSGGRDQRRRRRRSRAPVHRELDGDKSPADDFVPAEGRRPEVRRRAARARLRPLRAARRPDAGGDRTARRPARRVQRPASTRDRIVEQADYLARGDIDGYEQKFGKL